HGEPGTTLSKAGALLFGRARQTSTFDFELDTVQVKSSPGQVGGGTGALSLEQGREESLCGTLETRLGCAEENEESSSKDQGREERELQKGAEEAGSWSLGGGTRGSGFRGHVYSSRRLGSGFVSGPNPEKSLSAIPSAESGSTLHGSEKDRPTVTVSPPRSSWRSNSSSSEISNRSSKSSFNFTLMSLNAS